MNNKLTKYYILFLCSFLLLSCTNRPKGVLSSSKLENTLYDIYLAQALIQANSRYAQAEAKDSLLTGILAKHDVTQAQLDSSIVWYSSQGEIYYKINDRVSKRLKELQDEIVVDERSSSVNIREKFDGFKLPPSILLGGKGNPSFIGFQIDSMKLSQIDTAAFDFNFKTLGIARKSNVLAVVRFEYKDTVVFKKTYLTNNTYYSLSKPTIKGRKLQKISGYIRVKNSLNIFPAVFIYDLNYKKVAPKKKTPVDNRMKDSTKPSGRQPMIPVPKE